VDLLAYGSALFFVETAQRLLHGSGTGSDIQWVLGDIPRYARHVRGTPCKNFDVCIEKVDEHCFLFGVELGADPDLLAGVVAGVERDGLNCLSRFEVAGVALRIRHVTPDFKGQSRVHLIHAPKKTTYIITECIEINVTNHQSIYYIAEDLLQNKSVNIKRTKDRRRQCRLRNAT
jgi:hypothetical protein